MVKEQPSASVGRKPGELRIEQHPGALCTTFAGHATLEHARSIVDAQLTCMRDYGRIRTFHDWQAGESYESEARVALTEFTRECQRDLIESHILVRSKLFAMGMSVANLMLGGSLVVHTDRQAFSKARREGLLRARQDAQLES